MYALFASAEGDSYLCVPPDPGIAAAALGASESSLPGTAPAEALHTFTLDSGLHIPSFSTNLVSTAALQDAMPPQVAASAQVATPCSCRLLSHLTLLWHHRLGHPSRPRLRGMHSRLLVSGLPRSLPPLPPSLALPCLRGVEGRQRAAPHSSLFPPTTAPLQTLHINVWGPARISGQGREHYFLLSVSSFASGSARTLPSYVCTLTEVLNLWPRVSLPETSHTLRWTVEVGDASVFRVWGSRSFVHHSSADKLSARAIPRVFLGFPPDAPGWQFYHPTSRRVFPSQDVTFDESVPFYILFPCRSAPPPPPPLFLAPGPPPVDPLLPWGPAPSGVSQVDPLPGTVPIEVASDSGAARGAASRGVEPGGAESEGAGSGGAESGGAEPGEGAEFRGAKPLGAALCGDPAGASLSLSPRPKTLSPQQLREWLVRRARLRSGATRAGATRDAGAGGAGVTSGAGGNGGTMAAGTRGARSRGIGAAGTGGVGGAGAGDPTEPGYPGSGGAGTGGTSAGGAGGGGAGDVGAGAGGTGARGA
ncbi:unnamed protein product [Closterium sp. NIES-54]